MVKTHSSQKTSRFPTCSSNFKNKNSKDTLLTIPKNDLAQLEVGLEVCVKAPQSLFSPVKSPKFITVTKEMAWGQE